MDKSQITRSRLDDFASTMKLWPPGQAPIATPPQYQVFRGQVPSEQLLASLVASYQKCFTEPPWKEDWPTQAVLAKIKRELDMKGSFITLFVPNGSVAGFSWGAVVPVSALPVRIAPALEKRPEEIEPLLESLGHLRADSCIVYLDELAVRPGFRSLRQIVFLFRTALEEGLAADLKAMVLWTTPSSNIFRVLSAAGFGVVWETESQGKKIAFLYDPDYHSLLKVLQNRDWKQTALAMLPMSR